MNRQEAEIILQKTFKLTRFYDEQWTTIEKILSGDRVLLIEKQVLGNHSVFSSLPFYIKVQL
jgi:ATP-dependent DNA helicase RecQ